MTIQKATYADLVAAPAHLIAEIMDGRLVTRGYLGPRDAFAHTQLLFLLNDGQRRGRQPTDLVFMPRPELHLGDDIIVPEVALWTRGELTGVNEWIDFNKRPYWTCEIVSELTDRHVHVRRCAIMARAGIRRMWRLNTEQKMLESFKLTSSARWTLVATFGAGDTVTDPLFPEINFPFDDLWFPSA